jgi:hypothetical protein
MNKENTYKRKKKSYSLHPILLIQLFKETHLMHCLSNKKGIDFSNQLKGKLEKLLTLCLTTFQRGLYLGHPKMK